MLTKACRYAVVKKVCRKSGFEFSAEASGDWDLCWSDVVVHAEQVSKMLPHQRINAHPGMAALAAKNNLARSLSRMARVFKDDFNFAPQTWVLPQDQFKLQDEFSRKKRKTFIVKPVHDCQGRGIYLAKRFEDIDLSSGDQYVAQRYMSKPYLIEGLKFDLRVYVLIYGVDPLRVFMFQEGLARFATEAYTAPKKKNLNNLFMHLTNYAINKQSGNFVKSRGVEDEEGSKRSLTTVLDYMEANEEGFDREDMME